MTETAWGHKPAADDAPDDTIPVQLTPFQAELLDRLDRIAEAIAPDRPPHFLDPLLDAEPAALGAAIDAGTAALHNIKTLDGHTHQELKRMAERVIQAALLQVTHPTNP